MWELWLELVPGPVVVGAAARYGGPCAPKIELRLLQVHPSIFAAQLWGIRVSTADLYTQTQVHAQLAPDPLPGARKRCCSRPFMEEGGDGLRTIALLRDFLSVAGHHEPTLGWEAAGEELWDASASAEDAALQVQHGVPAVLQTVVRAVLDRPHEAHGARVIEICMGVMANLASHSELCSQLLRQQGLAALVVDRVLWQNDAAVLSEACRLASGMLLATCQDVHDWCQLLSTEEALGRVVWILENTLHSGLLERALELLSALLTALEANAEAMLGKLLAVDLLPLLVSVLMGWVERLQREEAEFGGRAGSPLSGSDSVGAGGVLPQTPPQQPPLQQPQQLPQPQSRQQPAGQPQPMEQAQLPAQRPQARVAAEVTQAALSEALHLLNTMASLECGCDALSASEPARHALVQLLAVSDDEHTQLSCLTALAAVDGAEPQLLASPAALGAVASALAAAGSSLAVGDEETEAAWSLVSRAARWLATGQAGAAAPAALNLLCQYVGVLAADGWAARERLSQHQQYALSQLRHALAGAPTPVWQLALQAIDAFLARRRP